MEPEGNLVDILEYRKDVDFYCSPYKQAAGYKFEKEKLRDDIQEELHKYAIPALGSKNPAGDHAASLGQLLFYFVPEFDSSSFVHHQGGSNGRSLLNLTPERSTTLAYWYIEAVHRNWEQIEPVEEELIDSLMHYLKFRIKQQAYRKARSEELQNIPFLDENFKVQKRTYRTVEDLKERKTELEQELEELQADYEANEKRRSGTDDRSLVNRLFTYFQSTNLKQKSIDLRKQLHRKRKELKILKTILSVPRQYKDLMEWVRVREEKFKKALNHRAFDNTVENIQKQREKEAGLSGLQPGEFQTMLQGAFEGVTLAAPAGAAAEGGGGSDDEPQKPTFPPYLQLKQNYTDEEVQRVFQAINSGELELGDDIPRVRSMLLTGNPRDAIQEIRSILSERQ